MEVCKTCQNPTPESLKRERPRCIIREICTCTTNRTEKAERVLTAEQAIEYRQQDGWYF